MHAWIENAVRLRADGATYAQVAKAVGVSTTTVWKALLDHGVRPRERKPVGIRKAQARRSTPTRASAGTRRFEPRVGKAELKSEAARLHGLGLTLLEIGRLVGRSESWVSKTLTAAGTTSAPTPKMTPEKVAEAVALRAQGLSYAAIGHRLGVSDCTAWNVVKKSAAAADRQAA